MTITDNGIRTAPDPAPALPAPPARPDGDRLHMLDVLRFAAALSVVAFHVVPMVGLVYGVNVDSYLGHVVAQATRYGWMGVPAFFVISGFVICMSSWGRRLSQFATSRAVRLLPAYVVAVLITAAILTVSPTPGFNRPSFTQVLTNLTMLQGLAGVPNLDTVYWTLLVEAKFYLLFAALVWAGLTYRRVVAFCGLWLVGALLAQASETRLLIELLEPKWAPLFVCGIVLYLVHRFGPNTLLWCMLAVSAILSARSIEVAAAEHSTTDPISTPVAVVLFAVALAVLTGVALGWTRKVRWPGTATLGALTYPLYLLHFHVVFLALRLGHGHLPGWLLLAGSLAGVLLLSYLVHRLVERPGSQAFRRGLKHAFEQLATRR
ncbi:acyltransferase [Micromonospora sp. NPDC049044]|uniref:acyltransferase family protein n=1 Tax=Micromonospora sp. NPDC049044 TaxID=3154827 RepID=UPI0033F38656